MDWELEQLSVERLKAKLGELGGNLKYMPEQLPGMLGRLRKIVPNALEARTVIEATDDFNQALMGNKLLDINDFKNSLEMTILLMKTANQLETNSMIVVEGKSSEPVLRSNK